MKNYDKGCCRIVLTFVLMVVLAVMAKREMKQC